MVKTKPCMWKNPSGQWQPCSRTNGLADDQQLFLFITAAYIVRRMTGDLAKPHYDAHSGHSTRRHSRELSIVEEKPVAPVKRGGRIVWLTNYGESRSEGRAP